MSLSVGALAALVACSQKAPAIPVNFPIPSAGGVALVRTLGAPYDAADPEAGRQAFALCADCHSLSPGDAQAKGPVLQNIFKARAASAQGYAYSEALKQSGIVWDLPHLDQWIFNPHETLPGTTMGFIGVRNDRKRHDLIAYLVALSAGSPEGEAH